MLPVYLYTHLTPSLIFWSIIDLIESISTVIYSYFRRAFSSSFVSDLHCDMVTFIVTLFTTTVPWGQSKLCLTVYNSFFNSFAFANKMTCRSGLQDLQSSNVISFDSLQQFYIFLENETSREAFVVTVNWRGLINSFKNGPVSNDFFD